MDLLRKYSFGIFDNEAFTYVLFEDDKVWMSINPMEMRTAAKAIENGYGDVLVLGGGLGYYPLMVSLKENVSSVHIVESNPVIFKLLNEKIIPQFPNNKVTIELSDAYKYLDSMRKAYDTIYIDVWEDNVTGMNDYLKFVKYEEKYPSAHFDYWLENSLLDSIIANIAQYFSAKLGTEEYQKYFSFVAPGLWRYMEDIEDTIDRPEQAEYYMSRRFVKDLCKKIEKL